LNVILRRSMKALLYPILALAALGSLALLYVHVAALLGSTLGFVHFLHYLVPGLFVVWIPTILVSGAMTRDFKQKDFWRAALRGCPAWMRLAVWIIFGYAWAGLFAFPLLFGGGMESPANKARYMSAVLLSFYTISVAVLYSAGRAKRFDASHYCLNGHKMSPSAKFCEECGAPAAPALQIS
jgi:hypothetical protein